LCKTETLPSVTYSYVGCYEDKTWDYNRNPDRSTHSTAESIKTQYWGDPAMEHYQGRIAFSKTMSSKESVEFCFYYCRARDYSVFGVTSRVQDDPTNSMDTMECFCSSTLNSARRYGKSNRCKSKYGGILANSVYQIEWHETELTAVLPTAVVGDKFDETEGNKRRLSGKRLLDLHV